LNFFLSVHISQTLAMNYCCIATTTTVTITMMMDDDDDIEIESSDYTI